MNKKDLNWNFHFGTLVAISIHRIAVLRTTFAMFPSLGVRWKTILPLHKAYGQKIRTMIKLLKHLDLICTNQLPLNRSFTHDTV